MKLHIKYKLSLVLLHRPISEFKVIYYNSLFLSQTKEIVSVMKPYIDA